MIGVDPSSRYDARADRGTGLPAMLARLHASTSVGASIEVAVRPPKQWSLELLHGLMIGAGFDDIEMTESVGPAGRGGPIVVRATRARTLADVVGPGMRALVCGLNPSLYSADAGFGFATANNRFWNAALASGLVRTARQPLVALDLDGVGMTDMVKRATARSHHLDPEEYRPGAARVRRLVEWLAPGVVIFVGLEGWRAAVDRRARAEWQADGFGGAPAYVMPSTSGANAHSTPASLADHLRQALAGPER